MSKLSQIEAIEARKKEITQEIDRLQQEVDELDTALRVLKRFADTTPDNTGGASKPKLGPPRPEGTPTLFQMTEMVIRSADREGHNGLRGREIVKEIGRRYWPGVKGQQILPSIYQFAKNGRLIKTDDGRFKIAQKEEAPSGGPESASKNTGEAGTSPNESRDRSQGTIFD